MILDQLTRALGPDVVIPGAESDTRFRRDWTARAEVMPLAVVLPRTTEEVSTALRLCNAAAVPVIPQGGMTGLVGGAMPSLGSVAVNLARMAPPPEIDTLAGTATVSAGTILQTLQDAAAKRGLSFPVDFGARGSCQVGGMIATNAGGVQVLQHGMTRAQVLGLEAVLADGTVLSAMNPLIKNNTGYDLKQLFIGSEGTLGIITRAILQLVPAHPARAVALLRVADLAAAYGLLERFRRGDVPLNAFEAMWPEYYAFACDVTGSSPLPQGQGLTLLAETTGQDAGALQEALLAALEPAMEDGNIKDAVLSQTEAQAQDFWNIREANEALPTKYPGMLGFDVSLPRTRMQDFIEACSRALGDRPSSEPLLIFGHLGDGNLHIGVPDPERVGRGRYWVKSVVLETVGHLGGSISAEHGIGTDKRAYLGLTRSAEEIETMRRIKRALDPKGILNPGKLLPDPAAMPVTQAREIAG